jgi:hypothetical protein
VPEPDSSAVQGDLKDHAAPAAGAAGEHRAVVAEHGGRIPVVGGGVAKQSSTSWAVKTRRAWLPTQTREWSIQEVEDFHLGGVGQGPERLQGFIADQLARWKPATAHDRYRGLHAFFKWAVAEGDRCEPLGSDGEWTRHAPLAGAGAPRHGPYRSRADPAGCP